MILKDLTYAAMPGGWEMVVIAIVILLLFGAKKLPELAKGLGQGIREFKGAVDGVKDEINDAKDKVESDENKIYFLLKEFKFKNFKESQEFINKVGDIAETEGHHPDIWFGWGYAKIKIFTHAIKGLHESDFVLAAKVDKIS